MTKLEIAIHRSAPYRFMIKKARLIILPGVNGASLLEVSKYFFTELGNLQLNVRAAAVTYNFLMAMPPTFLFLFSLIAYLPLHHVDRTILNTLRLITPNDNIYNNVSNIVVDFLRTQRNDVLSYGIILVVFFSSNGVMGLMRSFDQGETLYKKRSGLARRWVAIKLTMIIMCIALVSLAILIVQSEQLNERLLNIFHTFVVIKIASALVLIMLLFCTVSIVYAYGPSLTYRFRFFSFGSVFATILSTVTTAVFFFLVNNFINYNKIYGTIGTLIAFMVWVWLNVLVLLIGYELNVGILLGKLSHPNHEEVRVD